VVVVDPQSFADVIQAAGGFAGARGALCIHLDVVWTRKPGQRKTYPFDVLTKHLEDLRNPEGLLFDLPTLDAMTAIQDSAIAASKHLRDGGEWAACFHAIADNMDQLEGYLASEGFTQLEAAERSTATQAGPSTDQLEQRRQAWISTMKDDLPAAIGHKLAQRILQQPAKYSHIAVEAAGRTKADAPGLPGTAKRFLTCLIRAGALLDTFDQDTAFAILKETKQPEKVLKLHRRRKAIQTGLQSTGEHGKKLRKAANGFCSALVIGESYTRETIESLTERHMSTVVKQLNGTANWWTLAKTWWNLIPSKDKKTYTVYHFLDVEAQVLNSKHFRLKPAAGLEKRAQKSYKEHLRTSTPEPAHKTV